jgi:general secretion pathway protein D
VAFEPAQATINTGEQFVVEINVSNVQDLFAVPLAVGYDPSVLELAEVQQGEFLSGEGQTPALVHRVDPQTGTAIISLSRAPGSSGASGSGTLARLVFSALAAGRSPLSFNNIAARNSRRELISFQTGVGEILVQ